MEQAPCFHCDKREMRCHSTCAAYKAWREKLDEHKRMISNTEIAEYGRERGARLRKLQRNGAGRRKSTLFRNYRR